MCKDCLGTGRGSLGIRGAQLQNRWSSGNRVDTCRKTDWQTMKPRVAFCDMQQRAYKLLSCSTNSQQKHTAALSQRSRALCPQKILIVLYSQNDTKHINILRDPNTEPLYWTGCWVCPEAVEKKSVPCPCLGMNPSSSVVYPICRVHTSCTA